MPYSFNPLSGLGLDQSIPLDGAGKIPSDYLPSYVDDVVEYADLASFPATGETGKIYVAIDTGFTYRWSGSVYVQINSLTGTFAADAGTEEAPSISVGTADNGLYAPAEDQLALATNGTERVEFGTGEVVFNDGGENYDFRIEGDTEANLFFVDASTDRVGIGAASPGSALEIDAAAATSPFIAKINTSEAARINSDGRLLIGTSSAVTGATSTVSAFQLHGINGSTASAMFTRWQDTVAPTPLLLQKSRGASVGTNVIVQDDDEIARIEFAGDDGSGFETAARISAFVDGSPGANDMPGRLVFSTTADGASSPTERMRIGNDGSVDIGPNNGTQPSSTVRGFRVKPDAHTLISRGVDGTGVVVVVFGALGEARIKGDGDLENTNNSYGALSDIKLKENIVDANSQWDDLKALQVRKYNFKAETGYNTHTQIGLVAQEVELVSPGLVGESIDEKTGELTKSVNYSVLYMKAVKALQEAMERIEVLEQRLTDAGIA